MAKAQSRNPKHSEPASWFVDTMKQPWGWSRIISKSPLTLSHRTISHPQSLFCSLEICTELCWLSVVSGMFVTVLQCWPVICQQQRIMWEEGTSTEKMTLADWPVGKPVVHFLNQWLMWEGLSHCRGCYLWLVPLGVIRKQAKQAMKNKSVSSTPAWPLHQLLPWLPSGVVCAMEL